MPCSAGLDSFATKRITLAQSPKDSIICVTTGRSSKPAEKHRDRKWDGRSHHVSVPFKLLDRVEGVRLRESSFRSRTFVFAVMSGIAAHLSQCDRVIVPESGQGTFGPWLLPVGLEALDVRSHPLASKKMESFLEAVLGRRVQFEHPRIWTTKGETLQELARLGGDQGWDTTFSCPRQRQSRTNRKRVHCGVCPNCLLRRQSLLAAGYPMEMEDYLNNNLAAALDGRSAAGGTSIAINRRHAAGGVTSLSQLAGVLHGDRADDLLARASFELSSALSEDPAEVETKLRRLLEAHRREWIAFLKTQGNEAFVSQWSGDGQC
jgi:hypothetical protein